MIVTLETIILVVMGHISIFRKSTKQILHGTIYSVQPSIV